MKHASGMAASILVLALALCLAPPAALAAPTAAAPLTAAPGRQLNCVDSFAACPGWGRASCPLPGVATYCPCMCGRAGGPTPAPTATPRPTPAPVPAPSNGAVLYSGNNVGGTYYYDVRTRCPQDTRGYAETNGYPACTSWAPGPNQQTLAQLNSNNVVAIDAGLLAGNRARYCGKKVLVYKNGRQVLPPGGGDFFVWDGCDACRGGSRIDFSVSGLRAVDPNACTLGVVPGVSFQVVDQVVRRFMA